MRKDHQGPLSLFVLAGPPRDDFVLTMLARASVDRRHVWFLTFPEMFEETDALVHEHLGKRAEREEVVTVGDVRGTHYEFHESAAPVAPTPMVRQTFRFAEGVRLLGYDFPEMELSPGGTVPLRLYWESDGAMEKSYHVFVHALGPGGQLYGQDDGVPQGWSMPATNWRAGELILDDHRITLAEDAPPRGVCYRPRTIRLGDDAKTPRFRG